MAVEQPGLGIAIDKQGKDPPTIGPIAKATVAAVDRRAFLGVGGEIKSHQQRGKHERRRLPADRHLMIPERDQLFGVDPLPEQGLLVDEQELHGRDRFPIRNDGR